MYDDEGMATTDYERGKAAGILPEPWQTDDSIGSWGYNPKVPYMEPGLVVDKLIDSVSKNGNLLLNIPIKADGTLDQKATDLLIKVGEWFDVNGEGIYGTRPWYRFGEGHIVIRPHDKKSRMTSRDIRYTIKDATLYAFVMDTPKLGSEVTLELLTEMNARVGKIQSVELLGHDGTLKWEAHPDGLKVILPEKLPSNFVHCLEITMGQ